MPTVNFKLLTKKNPSNIYCRFLHGRGIDITSVIGVYVNPIYWDSKNQKIKNVIAVKNRDAINRKLSLLKIDIVDSFNFSYMEGDIIDKDWLKNTISVFFNRPINENKNKNELHTIYLTEFGKWWMENKSKTWLSSAETYMTKVSQLQYNNLLSLIEEFQGRTNIKLNKSGSKMITEFVQWLVEQKYSEKTIKRHINRVKFFFNRAKEHGFKVDSTYEQRVFVPQTEEVLDPFLNPTEIKKLFDLDLQNEVLSNARDNLIIGCYSGLRVSDFLKKLSIDNFIDDFIEIKTTKTKKIVSIPVHPMVKKILIKHKGNLPKKVNASDFNKQIKKVCKIAGFTDKIEGRLHNKEVNRKVYGFYEKYKLISSHICRRSFATNLYGKIPNSDIMAICGWSKEEMLYTYLQKGNREGAVALKKYWETNL